MRLLLTFFLLAFIYYPVCGQSYSTQTNVQSIIPERNIYLNGGARAAFGGKSRTIIPVRLPQGTKSWYYSFSTSPGESGTRNLNLLAQLSSLAADPSGITRIALSNVEIPAGSASIDVYLFDQRNADLFNSKAAQNGLQLSYVREGTVTNTRQALVPIHNSSNTVYLGLRNPSSLDGVNITIEIVAEINSKVYEDSWSSSNVDLIYNNCLRAFANSNSEAEQICNCYKSKVTTTYTPSAYSNLSNADRKKHYQDNIKDCSDETGNRSALDNEKRIKELAELVRGQAVMKDYAGQEQSFSELINLGLNNWQNYSSLGFCQLCLKKYDAAKKSLTIGLGKNPTALYLLGNLADYYLLTGKYEQAMEIFLAHKNERLEDNRRFKDAVSGDLKEFESLGISNPDFKRVREELRID